MKALLFAALATVGTVGVAHAQGSHPGGCGNPHVVQPPPSSAKASDRSRHYEVEWTPPVLAGDAPSCDRVDVPPFAWDTPNELKSLEGGCDGSVLRCVDDSSPSTQGAILCLPDRACDAYPLPECSADRVMLDDCTITRTCDSSATDLFPACEDRMTREEWLRRRNRAQYWVDFYRGCAERHAGTALGDAHERLLFDSLQTLGDLNAIGNDMGWR